MVLPVAALPMVVLPVVVLPVMALPVAVLPVVAAGGGAAGGGAAGGSFSFACCVRCYFKCLSIAGTVTPIFHLFLNPGCQTTFGEAPS